MPENIATERLYKDLPDGRTVLVAAPGDPIPDDPDVYGYQDKIDPRADTADAALARGEVHKSARSAGPGAELAVGGQGVAYADPLPRAGEDGDGQALVDAQKPKRSSSKSKPKTETDDKKVDGPADKKVDGPAEKKAEGE